MSEQDRNKSRGDDLLMKYLSGTASDKEITELKCLAETEPALKEEFEESDRFIRQMKAFDLMKQVDTSRAFTKLKDRLKNHQKQKGWLYYWQKVAAVLILPIVLLSIYQFFFVREGHLQCASLPVVYNEISTSSGLRSTFELPDGTKVWLNGSTKIKYPVAFTDNERKIQLEGEAYFEVAKNKAKPFIIDLGSVHVQAVGTAFNCMAYPDDNLIETALTEGKVKITKVLDDGEEKGEYILHPGQVMSYELNSDQFYLKEGDQAKYLSWRTGKFIFRNDPLEVVCKKLGRWFNADIVIKDEVLKSYSFTGTFQEEGLREIFDLISLTSPISYTVIDRKVTEKNEYGALKVIVERK